MKKIIPYLSIFILVLVFQSCSSDQDPEPETPADYYFRYKINGVQKDYSEFVNTVQASYWSYIDFPATATDQLATQVAATQSISTNGQRSTLTINILHETNIRINHSYTTYGSDAVPEPELLIIGLYDDNGTMFLADSYQQTSHDRAEFRFTEINEGSLKGTFSGILYKNGDVNETVSITDGEFYVHRAYP